LIWGEIKKIKVKKIHPKKGVNLRLKKTISNYKLDTSHINPKLPSLFVLCGSRVAERLQQVLEASETYALEISQSVLQFWDSTGQD